MIQQKIREYADNMSVPFALKNYIKFNQLELEIRRNIKRELGGQNSIMFTSQDLRYFIIQLEKTYRALNKTVNFSQFQKRFEKFEKVTGSVVQDQTKAICEYMGCASELQRLYSLLNYDATLLFLCELQKQQQKEADNKYFNDEITELLRRL